jgi:N6-adenosine-specific RNA methylase IME4
MTALVKHEAMRQAIAECKNTDELKLILDQAALFKEASRIANDKDMLAGVVVIIERAKRKLGQLMAGQKDTVGLAKGARAPGTKRGTTRVPSEPASLAEAGIGKRLAHEARSAAALSEREFEQRMDETRKAVTGAIAKTVRNEIKKKRRDERELAVAQSLPDGVCGIGVEDFEWDQKTWSDAGRDKHAGNTYETATDAHTAAEIVRRTEERMRCMATDHALLFMWVTIPYLDVGIDVLRLRGYRYASNYVWGKENHLGTGYWVREKHEQLLIGVRGWKIPAPLPGKQLDSLVIAPKPNSDHSSKPDDFYDWIRATYPNITKVEFNTVGPPREGWLAHGNEVES